MLSKSTNYQTILDSDNRHAEVMIIVGEVDGTRTTYTMNNILALNTHMSLYGDYMDIGKAVINSFDMRLVNVLPTAIPKMSRVEVWCRLTDGTSYTNWLPKGIFYTRKPDYDTESKKMDISGLDLMYRGETIPYPVGSTVSGWNLETTRTVASRMATAMGIELEDATQIAEYNYALPPFGRTAREVLADIATACGGNFVLTYVNSGTEQAPVMTPKLRFRPITYILDPAVDIARNVQEFEMGDRVEAIGHIIINYGYDDNGATLSKEAGVIGSGRDVEYTIDTITDGDVIQDIVDDLYTLLLNKTCRPFSAMRSNIDPAVELCDTVQCNSCVAPLGNIDTHFSVAMYTDVSAAGIPEDEDFPYYSSDRTIVRNYSSEASKIAGAVKFVDLSTAGGTEINGSNIKGGTLTLGGDDNGNGQLNIVNASNNLIGRWDNESLTVLDDSTNGQWNARFCIYRRGGNTTYGIQAGVSPESQNSRFVPYFHMVGTHWNSDTSSTEERTTKIQPGQIEFDNTVIGDAPVAQTVTITRTSGITVNESELYTWGRTAELRIQFSASGSYSAGGNVFVGNLSDYLPIVQTFGSSYYLGHGFVGSLATDGTITIRTTSSVSFNSGDLISISFTYLF